MSSDKSDAQGEFKSTTSNKGNACTFLGRIIPWKPKCAKKHAQQKLLTASSPSDSGSNSSHPHNAPHYGPVQQYGQYPSHPSPSPHSAWNAQTNAFQGQVSYLHPSQYGTTRAFKGQITTAIHGVETIMPTHEYLAYTPEHRHTIIHPPGLRLEPVYHDSKPMSPPPGAPPPPPPIDIKTGKPLKIEIESASSEGKDKDGGDSKKCPQCHHASNPAETEGVWICSGCLQGHKFVLANMCEKH